MLERGRTTALNTKFDVGVLKTVIKRNWYWGVFIFLLLNITAFLYLRYTIPLYESKNLIQINSENQSEEVLDFKRVRKGVVLLAKDIEVLRSKMLFRMALADLPLDVSYYKEGRFLRKEMYKRSSFVVQYFILKDSFLTNVPISLSLLDGKLILSFTYNNKFFNYEIKLNEVVETPFFDAVITVDDWDTFKKEVESNKLSFQFNDAEETYKRLYEGLEIELVDNNARTVGIHFQSSSPELAKDIVSSLTNSFFVYYKSLKQESTENITNFISVQLDSLTRELDNAKENVINFQKKEEFVSPEEASRRITSALTQLNTEKNQILNDIKTLNLIEDKIEKNPNSIDVYNMIPLLTGKSFETNLSTHINEFYNLIKQKEDLLYKVTPTSDNIKKIDTRISATKMKVHSIIDDILNELAEKSNRELKVIEDSLQKVKLKYAELPEKRMEALRLMNVQELNEKYYDLFTEKNIQYSISNAGYSSDNKILDEAVVPTEPIFPMPVVIYGVSIFLSFILTIGVLLTRYLTFNEISNVFELQNLIPSSISILGTIPLDKNKNEDIILVTDENSKSALSEYFRTIRTNLSFTRDLKTIVVTSTIFGEGKTFFVHNLAVIIAMTKKKVLVVDLDLRKPKLHLRFNSNNDLGMSNFLAGHCTVDDIIQKSEIEGLDFITSGPIPPNPSELLLSPAFDEMFEQFKERYDIVLFDTPPIGIVSDGVRLLSKVDVSIYVFRANYSKRYFVNKLIKTSEIKDIKNLSVVFNGVKSQQSYYGGYGYYYGNKYYENGK